MHVVKIGREFTITVPTRMVERELRVRDAMGEDDAPGSTES